jgi:predicted regulator of Ras-like GTPase activity (Roadblock/LC7/MglB family)
VSTAFTPILQRAVERIPGAMGAIFADWDGEAVDHFSHADRFDMLVLTAHLGIILSHVQRAMRLFHYGEAQEIVLLQQKMDLIVRSVGQGYYMVLVATGGVHLATALREVSVAAGALRQEMY